MADRLTSDFYAYEFDDGAKVVVPAAIAEINDKIRAIAVQAYQTLGCAGMARVDVPQRTLAINGSAHCPATNISMSKLWQTQRSQLHRSDHTFD